MTSCAPTLRISLRAGSHILFKNSTRSRSSSCYGGRRCSAGIGGGITRKGAFHLIRQQRSSKIIQVIGGTRALCSSTCSTTSTCSRFADADNDPTAAAAAAAAALLVSATIMAATTTTLDSPYSATQQQSNNCDGPTDNYNNWNNSSSIAIRQRLISQLNNNINIGNNINNSFLISSPKKSLCDNSRSSSGGGDGQQQQQQQPVVVKKKRAKTPRNAMVVSRRSLRARGLNEKYNVDWKTVLGEGAYGSVHPARLATTGEKVALKKISRRYTSASGFKTETEALLRIYDNGGHPNISGLRDMYEDHNYFYLILDLVSGGEMFEHLINYGAYSEADAARLMQEIASALAFLHGVGVVHADLKPENLLLSTKNRHDGTIKVIDFGCAVVEEETDDDDGHGLFAFSRPAKIAAKTAASTGTTAYWPPERFKKGTLASQEMDMWSMGVILYIMLTGVHPFDVKGVSTDAEIEECIRLDPTPPLDDELVGHLSESAVDLIVKLMEKDPRKRLTAYEMIQHPWVRGETALTEKMEDSDKKLSRFQDLRAKMEAAMFSVMVSQSHSNARMSEAKVQPERSDNIDTTILQRAFAVFDAEGKGFITSDDLGRVTSQYTGTKISPRDTREFLATQGGGGGVAAATESHLSLSQFNKLFKGLKNRHFPRGHYIFHAGEKGDAMYFLSSGKVEIQTRKGQLVSILRSGDFFGEGSLLGNEKERENRRFTTAKCATPVDVIEIRREDFDRYCGASKGTRTEILTKWRARTLDYAKNLLRLQKNVKDRTFKKGDTIYKEGEEGTSMFRVHDLNGGILDVSHDGHSVHQYTNGDSFGESSLLFKRPRSSTVTCSSDTCRLHEMKGEDFLALVESSPNMAAALRNMCRKRLFKKAIKSYSLTRNRGLKDEDLVATFYDADIDSSGMLNLDEVRRIMHQMDPNFPMEDIRALLKFADCDQDGKISLEEFKALFRQFENVKADELEE